MLDFKGTMAYFKQKFGRCLNRIVHTFFFKLLALGMELSLGSFSVNSAMRYISLMQILIFVHEED